MIRRYLLLLAAGLAPATAASAQTATTRLDAVPGVPEIDKSTQAEDVKFKDDSENRMTVPVRLSGLGPYDFLVDTGADRSAISHQLIARLGIQKSGEVSLHSLSGASSISTARLSDVQLTRVPEPSIDAAVLDRDHMGADGIVGVDLLRSQRVQFDFEKQTMTVVPSATPDFATEPGTIVVRARRKSGRLVVTDAEANGERLTVVLDTGSQVSIGNMALRRRLLRDNLVSVESRVALESVTGQKIYGDSMMVRELKIGGMTLSNLAIVFTDAHTFQQLGFNKTPALLLGMNAIRAFKKVSIDFANKKFRVVLPEHSSIDTRVAAVFR
jgi:predicted aspartyl protease